MRLIDATVIEWKVEQFLQYRYEDYGLMFGPGLEILNIIRNAPTIAPPPNAPLTLDELREMDGEPVFLKRPGYCDRWALVMVHPEVNTPFFLFHLGGVVLAKLELEQGAKAYRRKPEEESIGDRV